MTKKDDVLAVLPSLTVPELKVVHAACAALLGVSASPDREAPTGPQGWLYDALMAVTGRSTPYSVFAGSMGGKSFKKNAPEFIKFCKQCFPTAMAKKVSAIAIMRLLLTLLMNDLRGRGVPATVGIILTNLPRIKEIFDQSFPGYIASGMTDLISKTVIQNNNVKG